MMFRPSGRVEEEGRVVVESKEGGKRKRDERLC